MARFSDVDVFLAVVQNGAFRGAASGLGITRSTVSRAVARLEDHVGVRLLHRDTTTVRLTDAGDAYHRRARRAATALAEAERAARASVGEMRGTVRVSAPNAFGPGPIIEAVARFLSEHPDVQVELLLTDRLVHPVLEDVDLAIRTGARLQDSDLKSSRIAKLPLIAVASPAVAEALDAVVVPYVAFAHARGPRAYTEPPVPFATRLVVDDYLSLHAAVLRGAGVGVVNRRLVEDDLNSGRLVAVLERWKLPTANVWAVTPAGAEEAKVKALRDGVREALVGGAAR